MNVGKTISNWNVVKHNIEAKFNDRLRVAQQYENYGMSLAEVNSLVFDYCIPPEKYAKMLELGSDFFAQTKELRVDVHYYDANGVMFEERYTMNFDSARLITPKHNTYYAVDIHLENGSPINNVFARRRAACLAINNERAAFVTQVQQVWDSCASVNAFVKAWPPGLELLNDDMRERLDRKPEKREKADIDQAALQSLSVQLLKAKVAA